MVPRADARAQTLLSALCTLLSNKKCLEWGIFYLRGNLTAACAAAKRAIGTRNGLHDTELNPIL